eukprot:scaffold340004_cov20-Attheya_sp.AAC.1
MMVIGPPSMHQFHDGINVEGFMGGNVILNDMKWQSPCQNGPLLCGSSSIRRIIRGSRLQ